MWSFSSGFLSWSFHRLGEIQGAAADQEIHNSTLISDSFVKTLHKSQLFPQEVNFPAMTRVISHPLAGVKFSHY